MNELIQEFNQISEEQSSIVDEKQLQSWPEFAYEHRTPKFLEMMLPEDIGLRIFMLEDFQNPDHAYGLGQMFQDGQRIARVSGSLDAEQDEPYRHLFEKRGWRTILYAYVEIVQNPNPDIQEESEIRMVVATTILLVSNQADALNADGFRKTYNALLVAINAYLLRIGFTWFANRAKMLWESLPGLVMMISKDTIFEMNDRAKEWFGISDFNRRDAKPSRDVLPAELTAWLAEMIESGLPLPGDTVTHPLWISDKAGLKRCIQSELYIYRPMQHIEGHREMAMPYRGISMEEIDTQLRILQIRDITELCDAQMLQREIELARKMQIDLQPANLPESDRFEMAAVCRPANHIGGDLYDACFLPDGRLAVFLGDAAGHGADSALLAALVSGAFRATVIHNPEPAAVLQSIDAALRNTPQPGFVTAAYMLFSPDGLSVRYGLAGHHAPAFYRSRGSLENRPTPSSLPLGIHLPPSFYFSEETLAPGALIGVFSDGLLEMRNAVGETFDKQIDSILLERIASSCEEMLGAIMNQAAQFLGTGNQEDDLTAIIVKIKKG